ncbi:MAG: glycosyltransferase family A protein [Rhizobiaceae bacterium]
MISVIIPARNAGSTVAATIKSLSADRPLIGEVLLVDDGSDDGTAIAATRAAAAAALPLKVVAGSFGSAGAARNAGLDAARERHVFLLDADDEVFPGALALLLEALSHDPKAGLAVGSVLRRTETRPDKLKVPVGYGQDLEENARRYLRNEMWPIAMGSALFVAENVDDIRFPASIIAR